MIARPRIEGVLAQALDSAPLVVIKAPLGAGKSTLLSSVLLQRGDAVIFEAQPWHHENYIDDLIMALRGARPDFGRRILGNSASEDPSRLAQLFVSELRHVREPLILAIDNVEHFAQDERFGRFFEALVNAAPRDVRFVLSGRAMPPLALSSLLVRRRGISIEPETLPFTKDELATALRLAGRKHDDATVERIERETGGWAASVTLALAYDADTGSGATRELALRFLEEALVRGLDEPARIFFERISVFDKIDAAVLQRVAEYGDVIALLERLERAGAPFTREGAVFRTHPLVREVASLQAKAHGREREAHALAARALALAANISGALFHLAQSRDEATIERFLREHGESALRTGNHNALRAALAHLKGPASRDIAAYMTALLEKEAASENADALLEEAASSSDAAVAYAARAARLERAIGRDEVVDESVVADLREHASRLGDSAQARAQVLFAWSHAKRFDFRGALDAIASLRATDDDTVRFNRGILYAYVQTARGIAGDALRELDELVRHFENDERIVFQTLTLVWQSRLAMLLGRMTIASEAGRAALRLIEGLPLQAEYAALYLALSEIAAHEGNAPDALRFAELARTSAARAWYSTDVPRARFIAELSVARAAFLSGDASSAFDLSARIGSSDQHYPAARAVAMAEAAYFASIAGRDARDAAKASSALLAGATPSDAADAVALAVAQDLIDFLDVVNDWKLQVRTPATLSPFADLLEIRRGVLASGHLAIAVRNARATNGRSPAVESALAALDRDGERFETRLLRAYLQRDTTARTQPAVTNTFDLTAREVEILELLVDGLSNKEIAQRLVLSPRTVETHVERVLGKLEVGSRSRAIAKALRLGVVALST